MLILCVVGANWFYGGLPWWSFVVGYPVLLMFDRMVEPSATDRDETTYAFLFAAGLVFAVLFGTMEAVVGSENWIWNVMLCGGGAALCGWRGAVHLRRAMLLRHERAGRPEVSEKPIGGRGLG